MRRTIPYIRQSTNVFCGPAVVQMTLGYFNKHFPSQRTLARIMKTDLVGEDGTSHGRLADYLRTRGLIARVTQRASLRDIESALEEKLPIIVHYIEPAEQDDHYAIVTSLTPSRVVLHDPWNGKGTSFSRAEFLRRWRDKAGKFTRWMLVPRPTSLS